MRTLAVTYRPYIPGITDRLPVASREGPSLMARVAVWSRVARGRRRLLDLDDRLLADLGLTREAAMREAARPFWDMDAPARR